MLITHLWNRARRAACMANRNMHSTHVCVQLCWQGLVSDPCRSLHLCPRRLYRFLDRCEQCAIHTSTTPLLHKAMPDCNACGEAIVDASHHERCSQCGADIHAAVVCEDVWMPRYGILFCKRGCLKTYSAANVDEHLLICKRPPGSPGALVGQHNPISPRLAERQSAYSSGNQFAAESRRLPTALMSDGPSHRLTDAPVGAGG